MEGINPTISTSSFKPLSLQEIMMVPLAKQKQEDEAILALDELQQLESNSLDVDKKYVQGQIGAFRNEASGIADDILNRGVDRSTINKMRNLRSRKNNEFSLQGKTGQAAAAYNEFKANEKAIMARKDLTAAQKMAGLEEAKRNYKGVTEGSTYQNYVGASFVDIMKKGREIAKQMTPEQIAGSLGMRYDKERGIYTDGTYNYTNLTNDHITKVVSQALHSDPTVMEYVNEMQRLGLGNAEQMLNDAAVSAGNVGQVSKNITTIKPMSPNIQKSLNGTKKINTDEGFWTSVSINTEQAKFNKSLKIDPEDVAKTHFDANGNIAIEKWDESKEKGSYQMVGNNMDAPDQWVEKQDYIDFKDRNRAQEEVKASIDKLKLDNPGLSDMSDKEVYDLWTDARLRASESFSQIIRPESPNHIFKEIGEELLRGKQKGTNGLFPTRAVKMAGGMIGDTSKVAKSLGLGIGEFHEAIRNGEFLGFAPGLVDMPGAFVVQIETREGEEILYFEPSSEKISRAFSSVKDMNQAVLAGENYVEPKSFRYRDRENNQRTGYQHTVTELSPITGRYEAAIIRGPEKIPKEDIHKIKWEQGFSPEGYPIQKGSYNGKEFMRLGFDEEVNRVQRQITKYYDKVK